MPYVSSIINESLRNPDTYTAMQQLAEKIKDELSELTTNSFLSVEADDNISYGITIRYANKKKGEWPNGSIYNDTGQMLMMIQTTDQYGKTDAVEFETTIMPRGISINRKKGTLDQVGNYVISKLKIAITSAQQLK